ncbi:penicillin-binding protein activator [Methyloglobulus sp.]|uniref:penicillin-binding protein activator n=1 Tax=Methyloglobulus sp. TaxID=2518622 RepID=UPI00398A0A2F
MSRYYPIVPLFCGLLLTGCAKLPDSYGLYQEPPSPWAVEQNNARLRSIESFIQAGKGNAAKQQADLINGSELTSQQQTQFNLLYAQILLSFGEAEQAISKLAITEIRQLGATDKIKYFQFQTFAYSLTGNLLESAKARIALDAFLTKPDERKKNQGMILETLGLLPESDPFLDLAKAIKAVFLAVHSRHNSSGSKPVSHFYDTKQATPAPIQ